MTPEERRTIEDAILAYVAKEKPAFLWYAEKKIAADGFNFDDVHAVVEELRKARRLICPTGGWKVAS